MNISLYYTFDCNSSKVFQLIATLSNGYVFFGAQYWQPLIVSEWFIGDKPVCLFI